MGKKDKDKKKKGKGAEKTAEKTEKKAKLKSKKELAAKGIKKLSFLNFMFNENIILFLSSRIYTRYLTVMKKIIDCH